jgi:predicted metal-binding membrane protein
MITRDSTRRLGGSRTRARSPEPLPRMDSKTDRALTAASLLAIALLSWAYLLFVARQGTAAGSLVDDAMGMIRDGVTSSARESISRRAVSVAGAPDLRSWQLADLGLAFSMWAIMMIAMMTPSATPMILAFARLTSTASGGGRGMTTTMAFLTGYLVVWVSFGAGATLLQWALHSGGLISPQAVSVAPRLGGALLLLAGIYQLTPLKYLCLTHCRSPAQFLMFSWRDGVTGALKMGLRHGLYCVGCCWSLMLLLFVGGVMNLVWVAGMTAYFVVEKSIPAGQWLAQGTGVVALATGAWLVAGSF